MKIGALLGAGVFKVRFIDNFRTLGSWLVCSYNLNGYKSFGGYSVLLQCRGSLCLDRYFCIGLAGPPTTSRGWYEDMTGYEFSGYKTRISVACMTEMNGSSPGTTLLLVRGAGRNVTNFLVNCADELRPQ